MGCVQEYRGSLQDSPDRFDTDTVHQIYAGMVFNG